jgi:hypothetical protein
MTDLFVAAVSIAPTRRRRFLWAAWWTAPPERDPFRKPDAAEGGARTRDEALRQAERVAGRRLVEIDARWARAWARIQLGQPPFPARATADPTTATASSTQPRLDRDPPLASIWQILGLTPQASVDDIRAAYRRQVLVLHPDHGGDPDRFRALKRAHDEALARRTRAAKRPRRRP